MHEGFKYHCDQCEYETTMKGRLLRHIRSKHKDLLKHQKSKDEGIKYPCDQCDLRAYGPKESKSRNKKSKLRSVKHPCDQCDLEVGEILITG